MPALEALRTIRIRGSMLIEHLLSSQGSGPPLRVAVLLEGTSLPRPYALVLEHLFGCDFARPALVIHESHPAPEELSAQRAPLASVRTPATRSRLLYDVFRRWDLSRTGSQSDQLVGLVDVSGRLAGIPALTVEPVARDGASNFPDELVARIQEQQIDVALRLARGRLGGSALAIARHGVWYYQLGDEERYRDGPAHFWELAEDDPVSSVSLQVDLPGQATPLVLVKGYADSMRASSDVSLNLNRIKPLLLGTTFFIRKLKDLHEHGFRWLDAEALPPGPYRGRRPSYGPPSNGDMARFLIPRVLRKPKQRLLRRSRRIRWRVAIRVDGAPRFESGGAFDLRGFRWIEAPPGRAYADPHLVERGGQTYCLFEDLDQERRVGRISCAVIDQDGQLQDVVPALEQPYHLSYPFVIEDYGDVFMIPESRKNNAIDLYQAVEFPSRWEKVTTLLDGPGLDTTVVRHDGLYWFFVAVREPEGASEQLLLFFSKSLTGPLRFHPRNPISVDIRCCRPAGAIFLQDGRLIRPSQDCSVTYGRQLHFNDILTLTPDDYAERRTLTVPPPAGMEGVHTYNRCGRVEVLDGKRYERCESRAFFTPEERS